MSQILVEAQLCTGLQRADDEGNFNFEAAPLNMHVVGTNVGSREEEKS